MNSDLRQRIRTLAEPILARLGYDLVAVEWLADNRGPVLRLSIDSPTGVGSDDCVRASEHVSQLLDEADPIEGRYYFEVSSPGIERPLQRLVDFERFSGYRARVKLKEGPRKRFTGVIAGVLDDRIRVRADGQEFDFGLDQVDKAHLVLELEEYERLSHGGSPTDTSDGAKAE